jgi:hypothetical protein
LSTLLIRNYYTRDIPIDDGFDGEAVADGRTFRVHIRRFTVAQLQAFQRDFHRVVNPTAARFIFRKPDGDEQAMRDEVIGKGERQRTRQVHVIPDAEIERRRLEEMDGPTRERYDAASQADDAFMTEFCSKAITDYVSVAPNLPFRFQAEREKTGEPFEIKTGADLVEAFGGNLSMLTRLTQAIHLENTLTPEAKKALRSLSGSTTSSPAPVAAAVVDGATPAAIVAPADPVASASSGGVLMDPDQSRSGSDALEAAS